MKLRALTASLPALSLAASLPALAATDADLLRCRALPDPAARLACFDALTPSAPAAATPPAPQPAPIAQPEFGSGSISRLRDEPTTLTTRVPERRPPAEAAGPAVAALAPPRPAPPAPPAEPDALVAKVAGHLVGWSRGTRIPLDNGQVWEVIDDSRTFVDRPSPTVTITRGLLGSFLLEVDGRGASARVRRVR